MKKVYIKPDSRTLALSTLHHFAHSYKYIQSREERDDRFEDYEDYDEDENDFDNVAFWDD
jgi:hypothetical protein